LSLDLVIRHWKTLTTGAIPVPRATANPRRPLERDPVNLWTLARILSNQDLRSKQATGVDWALGDLIELHVLACFPELHDVITESEAERIALDHAEELVANADADSFVVYSTRRQMLRYVDWYGKEANLGEVARLAQIVSEVLPETANEDWN
jgi:hypothetical protein